MPETLSEPEASVSVGVVTYVDGTIEELDLSRPLFILQASKMPAENDTEGGFNLFWCAAGRPKGDLEEWLADVKAVDVKEANPTSAAPSE